MYVLEDNLRVPSGVSYLLENRLVSKRAFADLFAHQSIQPVDDYPDQLFRLLASLAPDEVVDPTVVVLTPGIYNSAYFEHSFLAHRMGVPLVEGRDLFVGADDVRLRAHGRRAPAGGRHLPAGRRHVPRPRGVAARLRRSACGG